MAAPIFAPIPAALEIGFRKVASHIETYTIIFSIFVLFAYIFMNVLGRPIHRALLERGLAGSPILLLCSVAVTLPLSILHNAADPYVYMFYGAPAVTVATAFCLIRGPRIDE